MRLAEHFDHRENFNIYAAENGKMIQNTNLNLVIDTMTSSEKAQYYWAFSHFRGKTASF
jgi:hypothetical protein